MTTERDERDAQPEHSHICMCEGCAPANRGLLERLVAELDATVDALDHPRLR